jgi:hypothetical protein
MSSLFKPWSNTAARLSIAAVGALAAGGIGGLMIYVRSPLFTQQNDPIEQPVQFDHRHHAGEEGIDCRYCHTSVEKAASAGFPPTSLCLNCHSQIWNKSPKLAPVRESFFTDRPIPWERVHKVPHYAYFNHSIHVAKGVGCATCHGRIDRMAAVEKFAPLTMGWCLDCHRQPEKFLRPKSEITNMSWEAPLADAKGAPLGQTRLGLILRDQYDVHTRTSCSTCHR